MQHRAWKPQGPLTSQGPLTPRVSQGPYAPRPPHTALRMYPREPMPERATLGKHMQAAPE